MWNSGRCRWTCSPAITNNLREQATADPAAAELLPLIPTIVITGFRDRTLQELCAMGGITLEDLCQSRAYREIFGLGEARGEAWGEARGRIAEVTTVTFRLLTRRCGNLPAATIARVEALPLEQLEALAEALLDFSGPADLTAWLAAHT